MANFDIFSDPNISQVSIQREEIDGPSIRIVQQMKLEAWDGYLHDNNELKV